MGSVAEEIYTGIPEWRKHAKRVYFTPRGGIKEHSVILCPDHRIEFYTGQPSAHERGEKFPLTDCEICKKEVRFETRIVRNNI